MLKLSILGSTKLQRADGSFDQSFLTGPKRLALLAYLMLARPRGYRRRDKLVALFWPAMGQKSARNALNNMLYHIREALGKEAVISRGTEELCVNHQKIWCDALAFEEALDEEHIHEALDLYHGDLLPGFHVPDVSNEFVSWMDAERERLRQRATEASWTLAENAQQTGDMASARRWAKKATDYRYFSEEMQARLIQFLDGIGHREDALQAFEKFSNRFRREWEMEPSDELKALAEEIRNHPKLSTPTFKSENGRNKEERCIAVLPFETSGTEATSVFASGIHSNILTSLSSIRDIKVISRTSVQKFANSEKTGKEIGNELNAGWLLEGDVQEIGGQVRVNIRLINATNDAQIWSKDYRRELTAGNLFEIQGEITQKIADALQAEFTSAEKQRAKRRSTENLDAYRLYMQGVSWVEQRTEKGIRRAMKYFSEAIEQDPEFALALTGRADALLALYGYRFEVKDQILDEAETCIREALALDEDLAEAHVAFGTLHAERAEGPAAVQRLKRAIELRPGYADAHNKLSWVSQLLGQKEQALEGAKKAVELDPFSPEAAINLSFSYLANNVPKEALQQARRVCELHPKWTTGPFYVGLILYHQGRFNEAQPYLQDLSVEWAGEGPRATLALAKIAAGDKQAARRLLTIIRKNDDDFAAGLVYAALGEIDQALNYFERTQSWEPWPTQVMHHLFPEVINRLKGDARFEALFNEMTQYWGINAAPAESVRSNPDALSIAVLPFASLGNEEQELFVNGIHDDLLTRLSSIARLEVTSRTSVMRYEKSGKLLTEISGELGVNWIVEGSVQQIENQVQVRVRLVNTRMDRQFWSQSYQRELSVDNVFDIQEDVAKRIVQSLEIELSTGEEKRIVRKPTDNLDAYYLYAEGRTYLDERTEKAIRHALDCFHQAVKQDEAYVLAWTGIADALSLLRFYGYAYPENSYDYQEAAERALEIDPDSGEAHASMGIYYSIETQGPEALSELRKAVTLTPSYAEGWSWLGWVLLCLGKPEEAVEGARQSVKLSPLAPAFRVYLAEIYLANGQMESALQEARRAREIQPEYGLSHFMEGLVYYHINEQAKAVSALQKALSLVPVRGTPTRDEIKALLAASHYSLGNMDEVNTLGGQIEEVFSAGLIHAVRGDEEAAFDLFDQVETWNSFSIDVIRYFLPDALGTLRKHQRYDELISTINKSWGLHANGRIPAGDSI